MDHTKANLGHLGGPFNTLASHGTNTASKHNSEFYETLHGRGSCKDSIKKRPKKKFITQKVVLALIDVAKENNEKEWVQRYWNTWHCQNDLLTYKGRAYGNLCKNRFCSVCVSIRKADMINKYLPIINTWSNIQFLTLTVKSQPRQNLDKWMQGMKKAMSRILDMCRKRYKRGKGSKLIGIMSLECNFNPIRKTYNPHYHILTATKEIAEIIKKEWVRLWNKGQKTLALPYLQNIRKVMDTEKDIIETIKYTAKIFTDPEMKKKKGYKAKKDHKIYAAGLHEIYKAMKGKELFGKFGFNLPNGGSLAPKEQITNKAEHWVYDPKITDYVNTSTGQVMTQYVPDEELESILDEGIDLELK